MNTVRKVRCFLVSFVLVAGGVAAPPPAHAQAVPVCLTAFCDVPIAAASGLSTHATATMLQDGRNLRWEGTAIGFAAGAAITWFVLYQGGSTGPCNRRENQDAWSARQCAMAAAAGGLVLAPVGYVIGSRIRVGGGR